MRLPEKDEYLLGVVADTHGLVRPEAALALREADLIIHAGDIGSPEVLSRLEAIAPVLAVRGNVDVEGWAAHLPETAVVEVGPVLLYVLHDPAHLDPAAAGFQAVISGHTHQPSVATRGEVLYLNPGSIGPRRFRLPVSLALLRLRRRLLDPQIVCLE